MEKKKHPDKDKKEKVHSTDLPNRDNKSPETTALNEDQVADDLERKEKEKHPEKGTWEPGTHPSQREH